MLQIKELHMSRLRNDEDFGFQQRVLNLATSQLGQEVDVPLVEKYQSAVMKFDEALKQTVKNSRTADVAAADAVVDRLYTGLTLYVRALTYHPTEATRAAAEGVLVIIDKYGKLTDLPYNQQYGALYNSMQELRALPSETVTLLALSEWFSAINSAVMAFDIAREAQTAEQSLYQVGLVKDARTVADAAYKQFVDSINAFAIAFGEANYAEFINQMNVMIADVQAELKARSTRAAKKKEKEEDNAS